MQPTPLADRTHALLGSAVFVARFVKPEEEAFCTASTARTHLHCTNSLRPPPAATKVGELYCNVAKANAGKTGCELHVYTCIPV